VKEELACGCDEPGHKVGDEKTIDALFALLRSALWQKFELRSLLENYGTAGGGRRFQGTPPTGYLAGFGSRSPCRTIQSFEASLPKFFGVPRDDKINAFVWCNIFRAAKLRRLAHEMNKLLCRSKHTGTPAFLHALSGSLSDLENIFCVSR
jgi:hypothetical protein